MVTPCAVAISIITMTSPSAIFLQRHRSQLVEMGLPPALHQVACEKILQQIFDGGSHFMFQERDDDSEEDEEEDGEGIQRATTGKYTLHAVHDMEKHAEVVLIDHMWTTTFPQGKCISFIASMTCHLYPTPIDNPPYHNL